MAIHERHIWASELLDLQPFEVILEIGCGPGITASLAAGGLKSGELHLLDRSEKSMQQAIKKNKLYIDKGIVKPIVGTFGEVALPSDKYDKIYCFNVRLLFEDNPQELSIVKKMIGQNGLFYMFFQPPYHLPDQMTELSKKILENNGFEVIRTEVRQMSPGPSLCHIAKSI